MTTKLSVSIAAILFLANSHPQKSLASQILTSDGIKIMIMGNEYRVTFPVPVGQEVLYSANEGCPQSHQTSQGHHYAHVHITYGLPITTGIDQNMVPRTIDKDGINAYWYWYYNDYDKKNSPNPPTKQVSHCYDGDPDVTYNCHGYSMGKNTWVQEPSIIIADEYQGADRQTATIWVEAMNVHSIKQSSYTANGAYAWTLVSTEKNGPSAIETGTWTSIAPPNMTPYKPK